MRYTLLALVLFLVLPTAAEAPVETYTLDDAIRLALRNSAELQTAEQGLTIARQRVVEAQFLFFPEVGLQTLATRYNARYPFALEPGFRSVLLFPSSQDNLFSGQAYMALSLYEGRRHINTLRLAKTALKQAESKYEAAKMDILYNTQKVFYEFLFAQAVSQEAERLSGWTGPAAIARTGEFDAVAAAATAFELRSEQTEAKHQLELSRLAFLKELNKELDTPIVAKGELVTKPVDVDLKRALIWATELRPELQSQTYKTQMDAIAVNLTLAQRIPTVVLGADYEVTGQNFPLRQNNWDATIGVRLPLSFNYWTQHTQKLAEQRQSEIARAELEDQVHLEVRKAYQDLVYWQAEWPRREKEYHELKGMTEVGLKRWVRGRQLEALASLFKAHRRYLRAVLEHILARARFERAVGRAVNNG